MGLLLRFNLIAMAVFVISLLVAEYMALRDIRARVHNDLVMTSALADYLIESQTMRLQADYQNYGLLPTEPILSRIFHLERLKHLRNLDIQFINYNGEILDTNKPINSSLPSAMPDWLVNLLADYLSEPKIIKTVSLAGRQLGEIHISHDLNSEITEIWETSKDMILPLLLVFLAGSLLIAMLASLIVKPAEKLLRVSQELAGNTPQSRSSFVGMSGLLNAGHRLGDIGRQLKQHNRQLKELNARMLTMHEDERKRLSAELHDEIGQHLTAIRFDTVTIASARDLDEAKQAGESIDKINRQLTDIIRSMLQRLRPPALDSAGLAASITELVSEWQQRNPQHQVELQIDGALSGIKDTINLAIYRAVQEALTNIGRHAGDEVSVQINLQRQAADLALNIRDNGRGCNLDDVGVGFGLLAMRERVEALAGEFTVLSSPGAGMTVTLRIPL